MSDYIYKRFRYKVYDSNVYVTTWLNEVLGSGPVFRNIINGGPGEIIVKLARKFDDFGEDVDVKLNNRVDLYTFDREQPNGYLLYRGYISGYRPVLEGNKEYVEITILNYVSELASYMLRDGSGATTITYSSQDPSDILKDVLDKYRADGGTINYNSSTILQTNTTVSYTFTANTVREAVEKVVELAPVGWFWTVDSSSMLHFSYRNALADHSFTIGKDISFMETWRRIEDLVNRVYFTGGGSPVMYRVYSNSGSISSYGLHAVHKVDGRVMVTGTADTICNRLINDKKDPEIRTRLMIADTNGELANRGYDIESITPGQTLKILNIKQAVKTSSLWDQFVWDTDVWDQTLTTTAADVIQIILLEYSPNMLTIEASSRLPEISKRIEDINRNLVDQQTVNNPSSPTAG